VAGAVAAPVASAAKPKLYAVSLSGSAQTVGGYFNKYGDDVFPPAPAGCISNNNATYAWHAAARMIASPRPQALSPGLGVPTIPVRVILSSLHASLATTEGGTWTVDPNYPEDSEEPHPVPPSACAFTPPTITRPCTFANHQTRSYTLNLGLTEPNGPLSRPGRFDLYYSGQTGGEDPIGVVTCRPPPDPLPHDRDGRPVLPFLQEIINTNLRTSAVFGLAPGRTASASGTTVLTLNIDPYSGKKDSKETIAYTLKVKRVQ
jgi:hypothetical protein